MTLLVVTQKVDREDENLGFFCGWLEELRKHFAEVRVIASYLNEKNKPDKIGVFSLGKERGFSKIKRASKFLELFAREYVEADAVLFHMSPEFVVAAAPFVWSLKKPTALWYAHKQVTRFLKIAEKIVDHIFTASAMSCRISSPKIYCTGHAIDTDRFIPLTDEAGDIIKKIRLLVLGRISPIKDIETVLRAALILKNNWRKSWKLSVVGGPLLPRDHKYLEALKGFVRENSLENKIDFMGPVLPQDVPRIYNEHDILISMSGTGSIDKSVLEAMASGSRVIVANEAFAPLLPSPYFLEKREPQLLAERIKLLAKDKESNNTLRSLVVESHGLPNTIKKIADALKSHI